MKTWIDISQDNILHNIKSLKALIAPETKFMAVLKSNAYGHGLKEMGTICVQSGLVDWYGVDSLDEALLLRNIADTSPILVLGYVPFDRLGECAKNNISIVAYNAEIFDYLGKNEFQNINQKLKIHIKIETGTSRQGIEGVLLKEFIEQASQCQNIIIEGAYTHFANIEDTTDPTYAMEQLNRFNTAVKQIEASGISIPIKHTACSAAIINYPKTHFNMVRAGISLYGLWSSNEAKTIATKNNQELELKPALTWKTKIVQIKNIKQGTPVSYGLTETVKQDSTIAILPIGYWDGYDRGLSGIGEVIIAGKKAKVLGRVCMNMTMVDITEIPEAQLFDEVIILGEKITAEEIAEKINTINYEVITRINPLIKRMIVS